MAMWQHRVTSVCLLTALGLTSPAFAELVVVPAKIELIPPGTVISQQVPEPWTHLIVKSQPRVTSGDIAQVSKHQIELASTFFMATLARVEQIDGETGTSYRLARLASGIGTNIKGQDIIVSPSTVKAQRAGVGFLGRILLHEMYSEQSSVEVIMRSETTAIYDTPIIVRLNNQNRDLVLRYAVFVDPTNGQLDTLAWLIDVDNMRRYQGLSSQVQWLPANMLMDCQLHVDASEYFLGVPSKKAFASVEIPQGRVQLGVTNQAFADLLVQQAWNQREAAAVEAGLRQSLNQARMH